MVERCQSAVAIGPGRLRVAEEQVGQVLVDLSRFEPLGPVLCRLAIPADAVLAGPCAARRFSA
jgi:hypothetical protein